MFTRFATGKRKNFELFETHGQEDYRLAAWRESPKCMKSGGINSQRL